MQTTSFTQHFIPYLLVTFLALTIASGCGKRDVSGLVNAAAARGDIEQVKSLVSQGADVNAKDSAGMTPLHLAASLGRIEVVEYLVSQGADINAKGFGGLTPLDCSKSTGYGDNEGRAAITKFLIGLNAKSGIQIRICCPDSTLLHKTILERDIEWVKAHVDQGGDIHAKDEHGRTPLDVAKEKGDAAIIEYLTGLTEIKSPLDLPQADDEDYAALREKVLAEERAKELALIEAERKIVPLVDDHEKLIPLDERDRIWITPDRTSVVMIGRVVLREGFLELLACRVNSKEHESILSVRVQPHLIHAALLAVNARQGKPMQTRPVFEPATGDRIDITLRWKDESGAIHVSPAQDWVWDMSSPEDAKKPMSTHWVFSGSRMYQDDEGTNRYVADETGELFGLSNFVGSILDVPIESSAENALLQFGCFTERIPPEDTSVTVVLTPRRETQFPAR